MLRLLPGQFWSLAINQHIQLWIWKLPRLDLGNISRGYLSRKLFISVSFLRRIPHNMQVRSTSLADPRLTVAGSTEGKGTMDLQASMADLRVDKTSLVNSTDPGISDALQSTPATTPPATDATANTDKEELNTNRTACRRLRHLLFICKRLLFGLRQPSIVFKA